MTQGYAVELDATISERTLTVLPSTTHRIETIIEVFRANVPQQGQIVTLIKSRSSVSGYLGVTHPPSLRDQIRSKLAAANFLLTSIPAPEDLEPLTSDELLEIGRLPPGAQSSQEIIDEERGQY
jgi:hypothetical protein